MNSSCETLPSGCSSLEHLEQPSDALVSYDIHNPIPPQKIHTLAQFNRVIAQVQEAISSGTYPLLIKKGSSGSYFCRNGDGDIVGIFKPKDEEPYGHLNPKWIKWVHRNLFPCCFGRACIIPNLGYISEAAASYLDTRLGLNIVPMTQVVELASPSFFYPFQQRWLHRLYRKPLPPKLGSFQIYVKGFEDAASFFRQALRGWEDYPLDWSLEMQTRFRLYFERMVVLDYLIRNTDRSADNWLVKYPHPNQDSETDLLLGNSPDSIQIAAIDHGLAFPTHHPDRLRSYPYGWTWLYLSQTPFSIETAQWILPFLTSSTWWDSTLAGLESLFKLDPDFKSAMWKKQKSVLRGQGHNLVTLLSKVLHSTDLENCSPFGLTRMPLVVMVEEDQVGPLRKAADRLEIWTRKAFLSDW